MSIKIYVCGFSVLNLNTKSNSIQSEFHKSTSNHILFYEDFNFIDQFAILF